MSLLLWVLTALIQVRGQPLDGGTVSGGAEAPLERAAGGETPVLLLSSPRGRLRLLLDTGASSTMVTPELVRRLALSSSALSPDAFALVGGGAACGDLQPRRSRLPDLELVVPAGGDRLRLRGVEALVLPGAALPAGVDGVLGAPTLRQQPLWIDPVANRVAFGAAALQQAQRNAAGAGRLHAHPASSHNASNPGSTADSAPAQVLPLRWRLGVPLLGLRMPEGVIAALADTGAEGLFLRREFASRLPMVGSRQGLRLVGFCGEEPVEQVQLSGLSLNGEGPRAPGRAAWGAQLSRAILTSNPIFRALGIEAIVGQELLRHRRQLWRLDLDPPRLELN